MQFRFSRRSILAAGLVFVASRTSAVAQDKGFISRVEKALSNLEPEPTGRATPQTATMPQDEQPYFDASLLPPPESPVDFPVPQVSPSIISRRNKPQLVNFEGVEQPGSIIVDPENRFLYYILAAGQARRYGVGVGRAGFAWAGTAHIGMKRRWPRWVPPRSMVDRDPKARKWVNGQPGGPDNPLGARALYLFAGGRDTLYRIHGTNEPRSIGKAVSSGCIRMLNQDVAELFDLVRIGTTVTVRGSGNLSAEANTPG